MSLTTGIIWEQKTQDAILLLTHAHDHVLFAHEFIGEAEVWTETLKTLSNAKFEVRMDALMSVPGMRGA